MKLYNEDDEDNDNDAYFAIVTVTATFSSSSMTTGDLQTEQRHQKTTDTRR